MLSTNIKDYTDIGLNADWCTSAYKIDSYHMVFENEERWGDNDHYVLCKVWFDLDYEADSRELLTGTFEECIKYYEKEVKR